MDGFYLALGVTVLLPFLQWLFPTVPKAVAYAGVIGGLLVMASEFLEASMKPPFSAVVLFLIGFLCIGGGAYQYLRFLTPAPEKAVNTEQTSAQSSAAEAVTNPALPSADTSASAAAPQRGPTLEATRNSKIDATRSVIPGDLPFQFGKADDGSIIDMPGTIVTRKEDGSVVMTFGAIPVNRAFPAPTGEFASLSASELKARTGEIAGSLREFQGRFETEMRSLPRTSPPQVRVSDVVWKQFSEKYRYEYNTKLLDPAISIASEIMSRIEASAPGTSFQHPGANMLYHRAFAGPAPALEVAEFLDLLVSKLPAERDQDGSRAQNKLK